MFLNLLVTCIVLGISGLLGFWTQERSPPVTMRQVKVLNEAVTPGGLLMVYYEVERHRSCHVHVEQLVYDSKRLRYVAPDEDYIGTPGTGPIDPFTLSVPLPNAMSPGPASYRAIRSYYCNPLQRWLDWPIILVTELRFEIRMNYGAQQ